MNYIIGLDIGIASVGFAALMPDDSDNPCRILRMGSRVFEAAARFWSLSNSTGIE